MTFELQSTAFREGEQIPRRFTGEGENLSPELKWTDPPEGTKSYALVMEDPDAPGGTFRHWGLYHLAGGRRLLPEAVEAGVKTEDLGFCVNDFGDLKYDGPMPPEGDPPHRYRFRLAALDVEGFTDKPKMTVEEMWREAGPHVIAVAELTGTYRR